MIASIRGVSERHETGPLRDRRAGGRRWNGGSISGAGHAPGPHRRAERGCSGP